MNQGNPGDDPLVRLMHAVSLLGRQQWERAALGGAEDTAEENRKIASQVLPIIEQSLDEDLIAELDGGRSPARAFMRSGARLYDSWVAWLGGVTPPGGSTRVGDPILARILKEFSTDVTRRFRRASRDRSYVSADELSTVLTQLRSDLEFLIERSKRGAEQTASDASH